MSYTFNRAFICGVIVEPPEWANAGGEEDYAHGVLKVSRKGKNKTFEERINLRFPADARGMVAERAVEGLFLGDSVLCQGTIGTESSMEGAGVVYRKHLRVWEFYNGEGPDLNCVFLIARVVKEPSYKLVSNGYGLCTVEVEVRSASVGGKTHADRIEAVFFDNLNKTHRQATNAQRLLRPGMLVHIEGKLEEYTKRNEQGDEVRATRISSNNFICFGMENEKRH